MYGQKSELIQLRFTALDEPLQDSSTSTVQVCAEKHEWQYLISELRKALSQETGFLYAIPVEGGLGEVSVSRRESGGEMFLEFEPENHVAKEWRFSLSWGLAEEFADLVSEALRD